MNYIYKKESEKRIEEKKGRRDREGTGLETYHFRNSMISALKRLEDQKRDERK